MPVFNDWAAAAVVCSRTAIQLRDFNVRLRFLFVDDGSTDHAELKFPEGLPDLVQDISLLRLRRNLGHQRAIAIGLAYIHENIPCDAVVLMDSDGEDRPEDIPSLVNEYYETGGSAIVFAERGKRVEGLLFRVLYVCYRMLHRLLTGQGIRVGNFSLIPLRCLRSLVGVSELWSHYAASVFKSRIPYVTVRADRGKRLHGKSHMNLVGLVVHGISALACFNEIVAMRVLLGSAFIGTALVIATAGYGLSNISARGILGEWPVIAILFLVVVIVQAVATCFGFAFSILSARSNLGFLPLRDYQYFIDGCTPVSAHEYTNVPR